MQTPVALIIFNRPHTTERVFAEIAKAKPPKLFVIADGPRSDWPGEAEKCVATRAIIERVDWECEVFKNYSDVNLGCGRRPATGISWVFEQVEEAIILEDDCVPHPTFFRFCEELLERYRDDKRMMHISGNNFQFGRRRTPFSYFLSCHNICWGWASWRRAWQHFDMGVKLWPALRDTSWLLDIVGDTRAVQYWQKVFDQAYVSRGNVNYWDYQWTLTCWAQNGLSILPNTTLVSNIGFGEGATHTKSSRDKRSNLPTTEMSFPLRHPPYVARNREADQFFIEQIVLPRSPKQLSVYRKLRRKFSALAPIAQQRSVYRKLRRKFSALATTAQALEQITTTDALAWFTHCGYMVN
jgi:hypothetical protein